MQGFVEMDEKCLQFELNDVNIGRLREDCPVQTFLIPNQNPTSLEFKIDVENICNSRSYGFEV